MWHGKKSSLNFTKQGSRVTDKKSSLVKIKTSLIVWFYELYYENVLKSSAELEDRGNVTYIKVQHTKFLEQFKKSNSGNNVYSPFRAVQKFEKILL